MMRQRPSGMPDFLPDDLPDAVLFAVVGVDPLALAEAPPLIAEARAAGCRAAAVQMTVNCPPRIVVESLRAAADMIEADLTRAETARSN